MVFRRMYDHKRINRGYTQTLEVALTEHKFREGWVRCFEHVSCVPKETPIHKRNVIQVE